MNLRTNTISLLVKKQNLVSLKRWVNVFWTEIKYRIKSYSPKTNKQPPPTNTYFQKPIRNWG